MDGNTILNCGTTCLVSNKRSIIVKNGSLYVKSNVTTLNNVGVQTAGQLFLGVMNDAGLTNVTVGAGTQSIISDDKK